jgi:AcrR family transcriptional regulator
MAPSVRAVAPSGEPSVDAGPTVPTTTAGPRPMRADARRNRDAVLAAAAEAFSVHGVEASLEDIARSAGVGVGTLYRHFPTRESLVFGVYQREVEQLAASAPELAASRAPADALREWMRRFVRYAGTKRGLIGMLKPLMQTESGLFDQTRAQINGAASSLLRSAADAGEIRDDIGAADLIRSIGGICMANDQIGNLEDAARLVDLVFDGLRYGAPAAR